MSVPTPTTQAIADSIIAQLSAALSQDIPLLPKSFSLVLSKALGGVVALLYKYGGFVHLQQFVAHASFEETTVNGKKIRPLVEWGRLVGEGDPGPGERAQLSVAVVVTNQVGTLDAGKKLLHEASGVVYQTLFPVPLNAATVTVTAKAISQQGGGTGLGEVGNRISGDILSFANPLPNVATEAVVFSTVVAGQDPEKADDYRRRVVGRFRNQPQGGAYADYVVWSKTVAHVVGIFPYRANNPGEVDVYVQVDDQPDGIPSSTQLTDVKNAIDFNGADGRPTRRPVGAAVNVLPIVRDEFTVIVQGLSPDSPELREKVRVAVVEYFATREPFIVGLSTLPKRDIVTESSVAAVVESVVSADGANHTSVTLLPSAVSVLARGHLAKLGGDITWA